MMTYSSYKYCLLAIVIVFMLFMTTYTRAEPVDELRCVLPRELDNNLTR